MVIDQLREANARLVAANAALAARVAELERRLSMDSSNSSRPPSSDGLGKPPARRQQRRGGGRAPGKQPGASGAHLAQVPNPDEVVVHRPVACGGCGGDLTLAPVWACPDSVDTPTIGDHVARRERHAELQTALYPGVPGRGGAAGTPAWPALVPGRR